MHVVCTLYDEWAGGLYYVYVYYRYIGDSDGVGGGDW